MLYLQVLNSIGIWNESNWVNSVTFGGAPAEYVLDLLQKEATLSCWNHLRLPPPTSLKLAKVTQFSRKMFLVQFLTKVFLMKTLRRWGEMAHWYSTVWSNRQISPVRRGRISLHKGPYCKFADICLRNLREIQYSTIFDHYRFQLTVNPSLQYADNSTLLWIATIPQIALIKKNLR